MNPAPTVRALVEPPRLAEQLGIGTSTLYRWLSEGRDMPPSLKIGGLRRWRQEDIDAWLDRRVKESA